MNNGPALWDLILGDMPDGAVIAGGAVRDYLLGVEPKDIDVFFVWPAVEEGPVDLDVVDWEMVSLNCPRVGLYRIDDYYERLEEYAALTNVNVVSSGKMYGFKVDAVELAEMKDGSDLVDGFDFGINQSWYTTETGIRETQIAGCDRDAQQVSLLSNDRRERSLKRFDRFNERHDGAYTLVDLTT